MLGKEVLFSSVVKGNAYGHSISSFCPLAQELGINHFSVFSASEALKVKKSVKKNTPIMIMGMIDFDEIAWAIENQVSFYIFEKERLKRTIKTAKKLKKKAQVHLEIETGMNRTGFELSKLKEVLTLILENKEFIKLIGVCTHLAGAESIANYKRVTDQQKNFAKAKKIVENFKELKPNYHIACSAAAIRYPKTRMDIARIGIMQYGFFPNQETLVQYQTETKTFDNPLKRIISWKSKVMDIKQVKPGEFVGYGTSYFTNQLTDIAIVPVGYANGFSRSLSNQGKVIINGKRLDVVGIVNMNMMAVDITEAETVKKGDTVTIIGKEAGSEISVASFSDYSNQVNYEMLTRLPNEIPRVIIE